MVCVGDWQIQIFLHRGINIVHEFLCTRNAVCVHVHDHVQKGLSIDFPSNSKGNAPFHYTSYDYSHAVWDILHDHLRDFPWKDMFKLGASAAAAT